MRASKAIPTPWGVVADSPQIMGHLANGENYVAGGYMIAENVISPTFDCM